MNIGVIGYGTVGKALESLFGSSGHEVSIYDRFQAPYDDGYHLKRLKNVDVAFIAVPTPSNPDGTCDTSAVEEVVSWVPGPICIKSTVPPGTTDRLVAQSGKQIVFSPEYTGETNFHPYRTQHCSDLVVIGGDRNSAEVCLKLYQSALGPLPKYFITTAVTAELVKYMENCFFATKITFLSQFHQLAELFGADFHELREAWLADSRVGRSHSAVLEGRGFGGRCLPKDLSAIIEAARQKGFSAKLLETVQAINKEYHDAGQSNGGDSGASAAKVMTGSNGSTHAGLTSKRA